MAITTKSSTSVKPDRRCRKHLDSVISTPSLFRHYRAGRAESPAGEIGYIMAVRTPRRFRKVPDSARCLIRRKKIFLASTRAAVTTWQTCTYHALRVNLRPTRLRMGDPIAVRQFGQAGRELVGVEGAVRCRAISRGVDASRLSRSYGKRRSLLRREIPGQERLNVVRGLAAGRRTTLEIGGQP